MTDRVGLPACGIEGRRSAEAVDARASANKRVKAPVTGSMAKIW